MSSRPLTDDSWRISVAIITYNWPQALEQVLRALAVQIELPYEVIVTDDGSRDETRALLERLAADYPTRLLHLWQPDDGARMSRARNRAIAAAQGDYVILLDGDMVAERHFVADHRAFARRGCFVQGSRVLTDAALTRRMLEQGVAMPGFFSRSIKRRRHTLRLPLLARWYAQPGTKQRGIKSCNMAFWRDDLLRLNGFNEAMTGWGREDTELAVRAFHAGLLRRDLRFSALAMHLYHPTRKHVVGNPNDRIVDDTRARRQIRCEFGIDGHLAEFAQPTVDLRDALRAKHVSAKGAYSPQLIEECCSEAELDRLAAMLSTAPSQPLISVALSVCNGAKFLPMQMATILAQQDVRIEVVAVDDGSSDESVVILNAYAARDTRVRVYVNPGNLGPTRSFERAMSLCHGEFLAPSDQDDVWHPAKLSRLLASIGNRDMAYCDSLYIDEAGALTGRRVSDDIEMLQGTNPMQFVFANSVSGHAMLLRRTLFERACPLEPALYYDWQLAMYAAASAGIVHISEPLVQFRRHALAFSAIGKASATRSVNRNLVWFDERRHLLRAWVASNLGDTKRAGAMLQAIERAYQGSGNLRLFATVMEGRRAMYPEQQWPALATIKLYSRLLRKLRRARVEAGIPAIVKLDGDQ